MSNLDVASYNRQGKVFVASNVSAKSVVAVATVMTGLILYNPASSNKKAILVDAGFAWTTVPIAVNNIGIALAKPNPTVPINLTVAGGAATSADGLGNAGAVIAYDAATLAVAPVALRWFGGAAWASAASVSPYNILDHVDGSIVLAPGVVACLTVVTTTAVGLGSFTWIEVPA